MLKINLLPPYIHQRKKVRVAAVVVTVVNAAVIGGLIVARNPLLQQQSELTAKKADVDAQLASLNQLKSEADTLLAEERGFQPKYDFITGLLEYNKKYPTLYRNTAAYTYREVTFFNLEATANQLKFDAYVSNPSDVSRLILGLSRNSDFQGLPQVTGVPGFTQGMDRRNTPVGTDGLPASTIIGGYSTGDSPFGVMGGAPDYSAVAGMGGGGGNGGGMDMAAMSPPAMDTGMGGGGGNGGGMDPGMSMGGSMPGSGAAGNGSGLGALRIANSARQPKGFTVTVTCALRQPITRPSYGSGQPAGGGMDPGMGGMDPGMMGGGGNGMSGGGGNGAM